jgi:hypothetical protein
MKLLYKIKVLLYIPISIYGRLKVVKKYKTFKRKFMTLPEWKEMEIRLNGDSSTSSDEPFSHYDAFYYWIARDMSQKAGQKILDVGGKKLINGWLSVLNEVTAVNLSTPADGISNVRYVKADVTKPLPFNDGEFDVFISPASLNLIGLGRYGDTVDAQAIPNFVSELSRCMKLHSVMYISVVFGTDQVLFNHHFVFSFLTIKKLFANWKVEEYLIDNQNMSTDVAGGRFSENVQTFMSSNENIIFLKLVRT